MRTTQEREELTVTIATALFLLVVIGATGAGAAYVVDRLGAGHDVVVFLVLATVVLAAVVSLRYLCGTPSRRDAGPRGVPSLVTRRQSPQAPAVPCRRVPTVPSVVACAPVARVPSTRRPSPVGSRC